MVLIKIYILKFKAFCISKFELQLSFSSQHEPVTFWSSESDLDFGSILANQIDYFEKSTIVYFELCIPRLKLAYELLKSLPILLNPDSGCNFGSFCK